MEWLNPASLIFGLIAWALPVIGIARGKKTASIRPC